MALSMAPRLRDTRLCATVSGRPRVERALSESRLPHRPRRRRARRRCATQPGAARRVFRHRRGERDHGRNRHLRPAVAHDVLSPSRRLVLCPQLTASRALASREPPLRPVPERLPGAWHHILDRATRIRRYAVALHWCLGLSPRRSGLGRRVVAPGSGRGDTAPVLPPDRSPSLYARLRRHGAP